MHGIILPVALWREKWKVGDGLIETFWNVCLLHDILSRDQLLREAVRVIRTKQTIERNFGLDEELSSTPEKLFQWMKERVGERELGHFPGDRDLFYKLYHIGKDMDLLEYAVQTFQHDRATGMVLVHPSLFERFIEFCQNQGHQKLLIAEAEKYLQGILVTKCFSQQLKLTLLTESYIMSRLLITYFGSHSNVQVIQGSIYQPLPLEQTYDGILTMPHFGMKLEEDEDILIRESEGAAINHLHPLLQEGGILSVTFPSRMLFQPGAIAAWRKQMNELAPVASIHALPDGLFRPYTSVKTYQIVFRKAVTETITIGRLESRKSKLHAVQEMTLPRDLFVAMEDWRIELLLDADQDALQSFKKAEVPKIKLREVADIFRGKSILKSDLRPGNIKVLNISNLEDGEVHLDQLETIEEEERKVKRYEIHPGDLVMTCRGTVNKLAVFPECDGMVIASANILVIRFKKCFLSQYAQIFLESPIGITLIQSFQRGTTVMNLNPSDIAEIELPLIPEEKQKEIVNHYLQEKARYRDTIREATKRWEREKQQIYSKLY
jgi:hypothetical protein